MRSLNLDRIRNIVGEINAAFSKLESIKKLSKEEFIASPEKIDAAKYNLIVAMEGTIDICNHIAVKTGGRAPMTYADCFSILEDIKLLAPEFASKLKQMAKFRNLLVHNYWKVDNEKVYDIIIHDISSIGEYLKAVDSYIQQYREKQKEPGKE
jgi:uncharacterized protein YutE (UPF0331/DUF86 family)